jgi:hypothetical protein
MKGYNGRAFFFMRIMAIVTHGQVPDLSLQVSVEIACQINKELKPQRGWLAFTASLKQPNIGDTSLDFNQMNEVCELNIEEPFGKKLERWLQIASPTALRITTTRP